ncbi:MAG: hypothetical protein V4614_09465 [Pseudomonadota bacterium]
MKPEMQFLRRHTGGWAVVFLLCAGLLCAGLATAQDVPSRFGKTLLRSYELPADSLDAYNLAMHSPEDQRAKMLAAIPPWTGSEFRTANGGSPYTLVIKILGAAADSDDISARWQLNWGATAGVMPPLGEPGARKGEPIQLALASEPALLEDGRLISPSVSLVRLNNLRLERVRLEVWSGAGETSWLDVLMDWWKLPATAAVWVALFFYWRRDRHKTAADVGQPDGSAPPGTPRGRAEKSGDGPAEK